MVLNYFWNGDQLLYKGLLVPKLNECKRIIEELHQELGHFGG
jgi:hypothetical protein